MEHFAPQEKKIQKKTKMRNRHSDKDSESKKGKWRKEETSFRSSLFAKTSNPFNLILIPTET